MKKTRKQSHHLSWTGCIVVTDIVIMIKSVTGNNISD